MSENNRSAELYGYRHIIPQLAPQIHIYMNLLRLFAFFWGISLPNSKLLVILAMIM